MCLGKDDAGLTKPRFQVLLGALLSVKTKTVETRVLPRPCFTLNDGEVAFGLRYPFRCHLLHEALSLLS